LIQAVKDYNQSQLDSIALSQASDDAIAAFAKSEGVSFDFAKQAFDDLQISAVGASAEVLDKVRAVAFGTDKAGNQISGSVAEMKTNIAKSAEDISQSLESGFQIFEQLPKTVKQSTHELVALAAKQSQQIIDETSNLQILSQRDVPLDVLQVLAEQGPEFVAKFVDASDAELRRLTTVYEAQLGAADAAVIKEGAHLETKGHNMIQDFVQAVLTAGNLLPEAAHDIVTKLVNAFAAGTLKPAGLDMALSFIKGLNTVKGLSKKQASDAANFFADGLVAGNVISNSGKVMVGELVKGLQQKVGLTRAQAHKAVDQFIGGASDKTQEVRRKFEGIAGSAVDATGSKEQDFSAIGASYGEAFGRGLSSATPFVQAAAAQLALDAKDAFDKALHDSPEYFTYYMGRKLVEDLGRGMKSIRVPTGRATFDIRGTSSQNEKRDTKFDLDVRLSRERVGRELDYSIRSTGR
jgi:hypothetical protein